LKDSSGDENGTLKISTVKTRKKNLRCCKKCGKMAKFLKLQIVYCNLTVALPFQNNVWSWLEKEKDGYALSLDFYHAA
jgi:hypothetical protein